jgi:glycosyltransferase involved in cell wall biosynthesis
MQKIKILVDGRWFDSYYSGVSTYIKGLYNDLSEDQNFEVTIVGSNIDKLKEEFPENIKFIQLNSRSNLKRLYYDIPNLIKKHNFDYAHFQYICPILKPCRYIVTLHDLLFLEYKKSFPLSFILKNSFLFYISSLRADMILTVSEYSKKQIVKIFKTKSDKIHITPNGILKKFCEGTNSMDIKTKYNLGEYILYVSRLEPRKNHLTLIKSYVELELYNNYQLIFIGKKTISNVGLDEYIFSLNDSIKSKILFIENTSEEDLHGFYSNASLFVYPSLSEGFGIPPIEAISCGTKTICSNATALADFDFLSTYQFDPNNLNELKDKIVFALNDQSYPIENYKSIINKRYNWSNISDSYKELLINDFNQYVK